MPSIVRLDELDVTTMPQYVEFAKPLKLAAEFLSSSLGGVWSIHFSTIHILMRDMIGVGILNELSDISTKQKKGNFEDTIRAGFI